MAQSELEEEISNLIREELSSVLEKLSEIDKKVDEIKLKEGLRGEKGEKGDVGDKGDIGLRGMRGERGLVGEKGERGETGLSGKDGESIMGINGKDGLNGKDAEITDELKSELIKEISQKIPRPVGSNGYSFLQRKWDLKIWTQTGATRNHSATTGQEIILCDCTSNAITVNLPTAIGNQARLTIKKIDSSVNAVTVDATGSQTIDGGLTSVLDAQYEAITVVSDNSNWHIV